MSKVKHDYKNALKEFNADVKSGFATFYGEDVACAIIHALKLAGNNQAMLDALKQCQSELNSVHSHYGDLSNNLVHSKGLQMAKDAIAQAEKEIG